MVDYLTAEVVDGLLPEQRDFLLRTSVLDRLSGPLCDFVLDRSDSARMLAELERADLFLVALDTRRTWYRYHRLFREALLRELRGTRARARNRRCCCGRHRGIGRRAIRRPRSSACSCRETHVGAGAPTVS